MGFQKKSRTTLMKMKMTLKRKTQILYHQKIKMI